MQAKQDDARPSKGVHSSMHSHHAHHHEEGLVAKVTLHGPDAAEECYLDGQPWLERQAKATFGFPLVVAFAQGRSTR